MTQNIQLKQCEGCDKFIPEEDDMCEVCERQLFCDLTVADARLNILRMITFNEQELLDHSDDIKKAHHQLSVIHGALLRIEEGDSGKE